MKMEVEDELIGIVSLESVLGLDSRDWIEMSSRQQGKMEMMEMQRSLIALSLSLSLSCCRLLDRELACDLSDSLYFVFTDELDPELWLKGVSGERQTLKSCLTFDSAPSICFK